MYNGWGVAEKIPRIMGDPLRAPTHIYPELDGVPVKLADEYINFSAVTIPFDMTKKRDELEQMFTYTFELEYKVLEEAGHQH